MSDPSRHPNFPVNLAIGPSKRDHTADEGDVDEFGQNEAILSYGIAGRVWDASYPILPYLSRPRHPASYHFSPASTIFPSIEIEGSLSSETPITILELGSGQSMATIHLLDQFAYPAPLTQAGKAIVPKVFLSDLPDVIPLCTRNIERWRNQHDGTDRGTRVDVDVIPLAWGDLDMGDQLARRLASEKRCLSHVLLIDLVYFPHLYPSLLRTLLQVTMPPFSYVSDTSNQPVGGPEVVLSYKTRSLEFEEPFFLALGRYFRVEPLLVKSVDHKPESPSASSLTNNNASNWSVHGVADETYTYICQRWSRTLQSNWTIPSTDAALMCGSSTAGDAANMEPLDSEKRAQDRTWGWVESQLSAIEWD